MKTSVADQARWKLVRRVKQLIAIVCITMILMISTGLGEERQVYQLAEDCPVFSLPGDTENGQILPKGENVEVVLETAFGGVDWSLVLSSDGTYGYIRSENLLTEETSMKVEIHSQGTEGSKSLQVGNMVTFGRYEQDNNTANGPEGIEWIVLDVQDGKCLLLSRYGLDVQPYNRKYESITWETCSLRKWLNREFMNSAFTGQEQIGIQLTDVDNSKGQGYTEWITRGGANTRDKVFLLSYAEANKYLGVTYDNGDNVKSRVVPTAYASQQGAYTPRDYKTANWWLRSPGNSRYIAARIIYDGSLNCYYVDEGSACVRPALWIDLESIVSQKDETKNLILLSTVNAVRKERITSYKTVGNIVSFGRYEQDNNIRNGSEEIEWIVLDVQDGKCLLLSRYGIDVQPYNKEFVDATWQTCTLRKWLNEEFFIQAFTPEEQTGIMVADVDNSIEQGYKGWSTCGGNNTQDKIFLLSYAEANKYLSVRNSPNTKSRVTPTAYTIRRGAFTASEYITAEGIAAGWWWLRSPGYYQRYAARVSSDGSLYSLNVDLASGCVRPALWIDLESDIF